MPILILLVAAGREWLHTPLPQSAGVKPCKLFCPATISLLPPLHEAASAYPWRQATVTLNPFAANFACHVLSARPNLGKALLEERSRFGFIADSGLAGQASAVRQPRAQRVGRAHLGLART